MSGFNQIWPGLAIFPLYAMQNGKCTCRNPTCENHGKHPGVLWSRLPAHTKCIADGKCPACADWHARSLDGLGIATGHRSGIFVIDLDGLEAIRRFYAMGPVPETLTVRRGLGNGHLYFNDPDFRVATNAGVVGAKIDLRGEDGYVVAPGSPHKSGLQYEIAVDAPVADAPDWLLSHPGLRKTNDAPIGTPCPVIAGSPEEAERMAEAIAILKEAASAVATQHGGDASNGTARWASLWIVSQKLMRVLELPIETAYSLIVEHYDPSCSPRWSEKEIWHKLTQARDHGRFMTPAQIKAWDDRLRACAAKVVAPTAWQPPPYTGPELTLWKAPRRQAGTR